MKNITLSVPDDVYRQARVEAAQRDSSVSALVAEFLRRLSRSSSDFQRREALQKKATSEIKSFRAGDRLERQQLYDRAVR